MRKYIPPEDNPDGRRPMFYSIGLSAKNMLDLNHLKVKANSLRANMCDIEFAIVQQVRNNTVVATYYLDFNKMEVSTDPVSAFPSAKKEFLGYSEQQVVSLQFGAGTVTGGLYPQRQDIGVAIEYKSSFDPYGTTYRSPIVFLTDEDYNRVKEGQVCDLHFDQSFVGEITGIRVMSAGGINATIDRACAATYHVDSGDYKMLEGWYSFGSGIAVNNTEVTMVRTAGDITDAGTIMPISFKIRTASASESYESGTRDPVKATIYTVDAENNVITHNIPDLRKYIVGTDENFITGKEQEVRILLPGTVAVRRVVLEPVKGDGTGGWTIQTISAKVGDGDPIERSVGERIYENSPKEILFSNVVLSLTVQYYNPQRGAFDQQQVTNNTLNVISPPGQPVYVTPSIVGSEYGYEVKAVEVSADGYEGSNLTSSVTEAQGRYKFTPPEDTSGKVKYYRITVISKETKDTKAVVNITVQTVDGATEKMEENAIAELKKKYEDYRNDVIENKIPTLYGTYPSTDNDYSQIYGGIEGKMKSTNYLTSLSLDENKKRIDDLYTQLEKDLATKKAERDEYEKKKSDAENAFTEAKNQKLQELQNFDITPYTDAAVQQKADAITDVQNVKFNYDYDPSYEDEIKDIERIIEDFKNGLELKPTDPDPGTGGDDNNNG